MKSNFEGPHGGRFNINNDVDNHHEGYPTLRGTTLGKLVRGVHMVANARAKIDISVAEFVEERDAFKALGRSSRAT